LGTPAARSLFVGAIPQSGGASWTATRESATEVAAGILQRLGVQPGDKDALLSKSTAEVLAAMPEFTENGTAQLPFQPVVDDVVLPRPPLDTIAAGNADGVHLLVGTNRHEMTLFTMMDPNLATLDEDAIINRVEKVIGGGASTFVRDYRSRRSDETVQALWNDIATDAMFRMPAIDLAQAQLGHGPVWSYLFTWETPVFGGLLRSTHALEIPFVFDNLARNTEMFTGTGAERQGIADAMHPAWIAFARTGNPHHRGLPAWPEYDTTRRATMRFDTTCEVLDDPNGADRAAYAAAAQ
jgi:para-nitrobenzyl esterase